MAYRVIEMFTDMQDGDRVYNVGDTFPHVDAKVSPERIEQLLSGKNRRKKPMIEEVKEVEEAEEIVEQSPAPVLEEADEPFMNPPIEDADFSESEHVDTVEVKPTRRGRNGKK
jgi:hypothetical protein